MRRTASVFISGMLTLLFSTATFPSLRGVPIGDEVPDFVLPSDTGKHVSLSRLRGSVVVLVFWRSEQRRSLDALKALESIHTTFEGRNVAILAVSTREGDLDEIRKTREAEKLTFPMLYDADETVYGTYGVLVTPSTLLIDAEGRLAFYYPGYREDYSRRIAGYIQVLLGEKTLEALKAELQPAEQPERTESEKKAKRYLNAGRRLMEKGMIQAAMRQYERALQEKSDLFEAYLGLGDIHLREKDVAEAGAAFASAIELNPSSADAHAGLADVLFLEDKLDAATESVQTALKLNPKLARAHYRLGRIYEEQERPDDALKEYRAALAILLKTDE